MWPRAANALPMPDEAQVSSAAAVIDVGSNSVRLVVYRLDGRSIWTVYNEKVLAGLGRDLTRTGRLSVAGVDQAMTALRRFRAMLDANPDCQIYTAATAAVRDARDGPAFVERVREKTGFSLNVISGEHEAFLAALGVAAGDPAAHGVVGDLGGSSLELTRIDHGAPGEGATFKAGPFSLTTPLGDGAGRKAQIDQRLAGCERFAASTFYCVGGAWRNLALLHMKISNYPLEIVHQFHLSAAEALDTARFISRQSKASLERIGGASRKRAETLPYAAAVLGSLIERLSVRDVVFSAYGVREGMLFGAMPQSLRAQDPLIAGAAALGGRRAEAEALGGALERWLRPAFLALPTQFGEERDRVMIAAACRLAELGARLHPDQRGTLSFEQVLRAPIAGQTHPERAFLAITAFARHTAVAEPPEPGLSRLLSSQGQRRAIALGAAIRLGCDLSGRNPALLSHAAIRIDETRVILTADSNKTDLLLGEQTRRRAETFAKALGKGLEIRAS